MKKKFLDLGSQPIANSFLNSKNKREFMATFVKNNLKTNFSIYGSTAF